MTREPLSDTLAGLVDSAGETPRTLNALLTRAGDRGIPLVLVFLALPFCLPLLPGVSTPFGFAIILLCLCQMFGLRARLPRFLGGREFSPGTFDKILRGSVRVLRWLEKAIHPRFGGWLTAWPVRVFNAILILLMGLLMSLPLPVPLTNTIPAWAILLLAACTVQGDGALIWLGYAAAVGAIVYFALIWNLTVAAWHKLVHFFGG